MSSIEPHYCRKCGKEFLTRDKDKEFCNLGCEQEYYENTEPEDRLSERTCLHCGKVYKPKYVHQRHCCAECYYEHQKIYREMAKNIIMKRRQINESNNPKYLEWKNEIFQRTNTQT